MRLKTILALALLTLACGPTPEPEPIESDPLETAGAEEQSLPELRRLGSLTPGPYLFARSALGTSDAYLGQAELISVDADRFVLSVDGGPHREVMQRDAWPMACLRSALDVREGDLRIHLEAGAPVFVLASTTTAARVSVALDTSHSEVVSRRVLSMEACPSPELGEADAHLGPVAEGDVACVFADQETLDEAAGLVVPSGAPVHVRHADGEWALARVELRGGYAEGWMSGALAVAGAADGSVEWTRDALSRGRCLFPGRVDSGAHTGAITGPDGPSSEPSIPPIEIERVVRNNEIQIRACYEARLNAVPDLSVRLEVLMLVDADGRVDQAQVTRGASADEALTRCVIERVSRWRFPPPRVGGVEVRRSFDLRPPPAAPAPAADADADAL